MQHKLASTHSKWGNLYRSRYWLNGRRISKAEFDRLHKEYAVGLPLDEQINSTAYRLSWTYDA